MGNIEARKQEFLTKARYQHGDKYDYSAMEYKNARTKVEIICPVHGSFWQVPESHLHCGCDKCGRAVQNDKKRMTLSEFVARAVEVHGDRYRYDNAIYVTARTPIVITCVEHGDWRAFPYAHLKGSGCPGCCGSKIASRLSSSIDEFLKRAEKIHGDRYDYSLVVYKNAKTHVSIIVVNTVCLNKYLTFI